jgi:type I restriction enzyme S subunit
MGNRDWPVWKLADLCESIDYGYTASAVKAPVGPKFLRINDIVAGPIDWKTVPHCDIACALVGNYRLHDGDIVVARTGATTGFSAAGNGGQVA